MKWQSCALCPALKLQFLTEGIHYTARTWAELKLQSFPTLYLLQRHFGCHSSTYTINVTMLHYMGCMKLILTWQTQETPVLRTWLSLSSFPHICAGGSTPELAALHWPSQHTTVCMCHKTFVSKAGIYTQIGKRHYIQIQKRACNTFRNGCRQTWPWVFNKAGMDCTMARYVVVENAGS